MKQFLAFVFYPLLCLFVVTQKWRGIRDARLLRVPQSRERIYWIAYLKQYEKQCCIITEHDLDNMG